jgi:hypothetical protein
VLAQRGRLIGTSKLFHNNSEASSETSTPTYRSDAFWFNNYRDRNLVPHHRTKGSYTPKRGQHPKASRPARKIATYPPWSIVGRYCMQAFLAKQGSRNEGRFAPTPTHGGDAVSRELIKNHRFSSSWLNLTFKRLLLKMSLRLRVRTTSSNSTSQTLSQLHQRIMRGKHHYVLQEVKSIKQGPKKTSKGRAFKGTNVENASQRQHTSCYSKAAASPRTRINVLLKPL